MKKSVELMLPVGDREMFYAAVASGADAVYFGVPHWNARGRTEDFTVEDVRELIRYAHLRGVRVFLAMNILIFEREMEKLPAFLAELIACGPDAFIIQDAGLARMVKAVAPSQEIHASTQMTLASAESINFIKQLGFSRSVLARELSIAQIKKIRENTDMELEAFVHGALCVSYSGQCLTSENFGGRSANRGQCAQSCRLPYRVFVDGEEANLHHRHFIFSPRDLCALPVLGDLKDAGVISFKVEGRLKSPEYVAAVARAYREAIDTGSVSPERKEPLEVLFSRGLGTGFLEGLDNQKLVDGAFSNHHGEYLGTVLESRRGAVTLRTDAHVLPGDGILFESVERGMSFGSRLYGARNDRGLLYLEFGNDFDTRRAAPGMNVYRNDSPALEKELHAAFTGRDNGKHIPVKISLKAEIGSPVSLTFIDPEGHAAVAASDVPCEESRGGAFDKARVEKELGALGATAYSAESIRISAPERAFIQDKLLRTLRKRAAEILDEARAARPQQSISAARGDELLKQARAAKRLPAKGTKPSVTVLVRNPGQIEGLRGLPVDSVTMDFDWGVDYAQPLARIRELGFKAGMATLRVHKPGENHYLKKIFELRPDYALVRNPGSLAVLKDSGIPLIGDYSLNAANSLAAEWFLSQGLTALHPSLDLNATQLMDLIAALGGDPFEISIHQYLPAFHTEYCAFTRTLTDAARFPECGKICTRHKVEILDHKGARHFLKSDAECRNTLFLGKPQSALRLYPKLLSAGVHRYCIELLDETAEETARKVKLYADALHFQIPTEQAARSAGVEEKYGVSEGQLFNESEWQDRKKC